MSDSHRGKQTKTPETQRPKIAACAVTEGSRAKKQVGAERQPARERGIGRKEFAPAPESEPPGPRLDDLREQAFVVIVRSKVTEAPAPLWRRARSLGVAMFEPEDH